MPESLLIIIAIIAVVWFWYSSVRLKELTTRIAIHTCNKEDYQFLDGTVAMIGISMRRDENGGLRFARKYQFEFSDTGSNRFKGHIFMIGDRLENIHLEDTSKSATSIIK